MQQLHGKMEGVSTKKNVDYFGWIILLIWKIAPHRNGLDFPQIGRRKTHCFSFLIPYTLWKGNEH